jgi:2,4-dienoyl-CoA reductase (NADPH2)
MAQDGRVTERLKDFYAERAQGGVALTVLTFSATHYDGGLFKSGFMPLLTEDSMIPDVRELIDIIHRGGSKAAIQLQNRPNWGRSRDSGIELVGPSAVPVSRRRNAAAAHALEVEEIKLFIEQVASAAQRAREAGADAVEFQAMSENLTALFLSPFTNKRTDEYGGPIENRARFLLEMIEATRKKVGQDFTYMCRIPGDEFVEGGVSAQDYQLVAPLLEDAGVDIIDVTTGSEESPVPFVQMSVPRGAYLYLAEGIKRTVKIPVIGGTRVNDPFIADQAIAEGKVDLVSMARALIADPDLPIKAKEGRFDDIRLCNACCHCLQELLNGHPVTCAINARSGREAEYEVKAAKKSKRVTVVGGGPAGMEAARVASVRGHKVTLYERGPKLGGMCLLANVSPHKSEINNLRKYQVGQLQKLAVEIKLNTEASPDLILGDNPEVVIVATGAKPIIPNVPGTNGANVVTALDVLAGKVKVGDHVVVMGGGQIGCETAESLLEEGRKVTVLEKLSRIGTDILPINRWVQITRLRKLQTQMETNTEAIEITSQGVKAIRDGSDCFFAAGTVVLAVGMRSDNELARKLEGKLQALYVIGDCAEPHSISEAIQAGTRVGCDI